jgi:GNAT superfamily N-acetyltransferase
LDAELAARGYRWESPISLLHKSGDGPVPARPAPGLRVRVSSELDADWLKVLRQVDPLADVEHEARLLRGVGPPSAYVTVRAGAEPVAVGRAVAENGWTGVFSMATAPPARRLGAARLVLSAINGWAQKQGASRLYLQVEASNSTAAHLYESFGFAPLATYHYRVRSQASPESRRRGSSKRDVVESSTASTS